MCGSLPHEHTSTMPTAIAENRSIEATAEPEVSPLEAYRNLPPTPTLLKRIEVCTAGATAERARLANFYPDDPTGNYARAERALEYFEAQLVCLNEDIAHSAEDRPTFLRMARHVAGLTQEQLSVLSDVSKATISNYERGYLKLDDNGIAERLAITCAFHIANPRFHAAPNYWITPIPRMGWENLQINGVPFPR